MNTNENNFNSIFAKNLRHFLEVNHMTQIELSKKLNVGTTSVYNWCNGIKTPRMDKVDKMCEIFGCKRSDLITDSYVPDDIPEAMELYLKYKEEMGDIPRALKVQEKLDQASPEVKVAIASLLGLNLSDL